MAGLLVSGENGEGEGESIDDPGVLSPTFPAFLPLALRGFVVPPPLTRGD